MHSVDMNMDGVVSYEEFAPLCFDILVEILKDELLQVSAKPATSTTSTSTAPLILRAPRRTSPRRASPQNVRPRLTLRPDAAAPPHARPRRPHALPARRPHLVCRQAQRTPTELEEYLVAKFSGADPGATGLLSTGAMRDVLQAGWQLSLTSP